MPELEEKEMLSKFRCGVGLLVLDPKIVKQRKMSKCIHRFEEL